MTPLSISSLILGPCSPLRLIENYLVPPPSTLTGKQKSEPPPSTLTGKQKSDSSDDDHDDGRGAFCENTRTLQPPAGSIDGENMFPKVVLWVVDICGIRDSSTYCAFLVRQFSRV